MNNPRLAQRYAKSLIDISTELKKLEDVHNDIVFLKSIVDKNPSFLMGYYKLGVLYFKTKKSSGINRI